MWQEYDCPIQKSDSDIDTADIVIAGGRFYCHWCGQTHTAQEAGLIYTFVRRSAIDAYGQPCEVDEERGLPADEAEKARWIAEIVRDKP
jgi:hypothetical protein